MSKKREKAKRPSELRGGRVKGGGPGVPDGVIPPPDQALPESLRKPEIVLNAFLCTMIPDMRLGVCSVVAVVYLGEVRQYYRCSLSLLHPLVTEFLRGPCSRQGSSYARVPGLGPCQLTGRRVGTDRNPSLEDERHPPTLVLAEVSVSRLVSASDEESIVESSDEFGGD